jgi:ribonuclease HI
MNGNRDGESGTVVVHADESCLGNQFQDRANPGGAAGLVEVFRDGEWVRRDYWISEPDTTNNRMAIQSAIQPLRALTRPCRVVFVSDSQYLVKGMSEWIHGWKRKGWKRKAGPIENLELWQELDREAARHAIDWRWVRGHAGHPRNEYANDLAVRAATELSTSGGFVPSGFQAWLDEEREVRGKYLDYQEFLPPDLGALES